MTLVAEEAYHQAQLVLEFNDLQAKLTEAMQRECRVVERIRQLHMEKIPIKHGLPLLQALKASTRRLVIADLKLPREYEVHDPSMTPRKVRCALLMAHHHHHPPPSTHTHHACRS